jgi:hypothetical protein
MKSTCRQGNTGGKYMEWLLLFGNMPIEMKSFLQVHLGDLNDFKRDYSQGIDGFYAYNSPSTSIDVTFAFETDGQLLMIWFPGVDEPKIEDHCIFVENNAKRRDLA